MNILILSFYFEPDLCAGSFRCTALVEQLKKKPNVSIDVMTTLPNRYASFSSDALYYEKNDNLTIKRIALPGHNSGMLKQVRSFFSYYIAVNELIKNNHYDAVYATSSRLFTAFLGARIANKRKIPLYLDIRDIFVDTIKDVLSPKMAFIAKPIFSSIEKYTFNSAQKINLVSRGFEGYFSKRYPNIELTWFTNGIDVEFLNASKFLPQDVKRKVVGSQVTILYAGNIGEGQGLHLIIPEMAKRLEGKAIIKIIGDGGRKSVLIDVIRRESVTNVQLAPPVERSELIKEYVKADVLFLHLNDYPAFEKVLPSKIFEYAALGKPVLAGVSGYASRFLMDEVPNAKVFKPGDHNAAIRSLSELDLKHYPRDDFKLKYSRKSIMCSMADDIVDFVKTEAR